MLPHLAIKATNCRASAAKSATLPQLVSVPPDWRGKHNQACLSYVEGCLETLWTTEVTARYRSRVHATTRLTQYGAVRYRQHWTPAQCGRTLHLMVNSTECTIPCAKPCVNAMASLLSSVSSVSAWFRAMTSRAIVVLL